jgi:hypothetical protein
MYVDRQESWTINEVIKGLEKLREEVGPEAIVYMSTDEEGNGYAPLAEMGPSSVDAVQAGGWIDEIGEDHTEKRFPVVVLFPNA